MNTKAQIVERLLNLAMADSRTVERIKDDYFNTFRSVGLKDAAARSLTDRLVEVLASDLPLDMKERRANTMLVHYFPEGSSLNVSQMLNQAMIGRSEIIYNQVSPYLKGVPGSIIDFGIGNGKVAQFLHDRDGLYMVGYDVVRYAMPDITVPIHIFDGAHVPVRNEFFDAAVVTNVIHHEAENEKILCELTRIVRHTLVVIETVPVGATPEEIEHDRHRTFMNDFLYNRLFCYGADIPTPGTYETPQGWINRFQKYGWRATVSIDLGVDQKVIADTHHLLVFEK